MAGLIRRKELGKAWETEEDTGGGGPQTVVEITDGNGDIRGRLWWDADDAQIRLDQLDPDGSTVISRLVLGNTANLHAPTTGTSDMDLEGGGHASLYTGPTGDRGTALSLHSGEVDGTGPAEFDLAYGDIDPSAGLGLAMPLGSLFSRTLNAGAGPAELWFKSGSGDTNWQKVVLL